MELNTTTNMGGFHGARANMQADLNEEIKERMERLAGVG
jgi:hypothetical protein